MQSCANYKMPRPQRHPTPPKKFVKNQEAEQEQHVAVVFQKS